MDLNIKFDLEQFKKEHPEYSIDRSPNEKYIRLSPSESHPKVNEIIFPDGDIPTIYIDKKSLLGFLVSDFGTTYQELDMLIYGTGPEFDLAGKIRTACKTLDKSIKEWVCYNRGCIYSYANSEADIPVCIERVFEAIMLATKQCGLT